MQANNEIPNAYLNTVIITQFRLIIVETIT